LTELESDGAGAGGELSLRVNLPDWRDRELIDTLKHPDVVTASASVERLRQAEWRVVWTRLWTPQTP